MLNLDSPCISTNQHEGALAGDVGESGVAPSTWLGPNFFFPPRSRLLHCLLNAQPLN